MFLHPIARFGREFEVLLFLCTAVFAQLDFQTPVPLSTYDLFSFNLKDPTGKQWHRYNDKDNITSDQFSGQNLLLWTHDPRLLPTDDAGSSYGLYETLSAMWRWFTDGDPVIQFVQESTKYLSRVRALGDDDVDLYSVENFSPLEICGPQFYCLQFYCLHNNGLDLPSTDIFFACLEKFVNFTNGYQDPLPWHCAISLESYSRAPDQAKPCDDDIWDLTEPNWTYLRVGQNLQIAMEGGIDLNGVYWKGRNNNTPFDEFFGQQFWNVDRISCTLANPCQHELNCDTDVGSFTAVALGSLHKPMKIPWVLLASSAFLNINQQLRNQYDEMKGAFAGLALDTFTIDEFFPTKNQEVGLQNGLAGLGGVLSILGGFIPAVGPAVSAAGTIASGLGTFVANSIAASSDELQAQKIFSKKLSAFYNATLHAIDDAVTNLYAGESLPNANTGSEGFNITDMMKDGAWVDLKVLTPVSELNEKIKVETLARSIDALWKTPPYNKMWVLFTDLQDNPNKTRCANGM
ncbi:MAG: hypothetical protein Q9218_006778 [Villophora microphyllina]